MSTASLFMVSLTHLNDLEDNDDALAAAFCIILFGVIEAHTTRIRCHNINQLYLCHQDLLPNPWIGTPWQVLWRNQNNYAFITTMGFDVMTFQHILEGPGGFAD